MVSTVIPTAATPTAPATTTSPAIHHNTELASLIAQLLTSTQDSSHLSTAKSLKNLVIGNQHHKLQLIHTPNAIPHLCAIAELRHPATPSTRLQAIVILASLTATSLNSDALLHLGIPKTLLSCLNDPDPRVVEAATRGLRALYTSSQKGKVDLFNEAHIDTLIRLVLLGCAPYAMILYLNTTVTPPQHDTQHPGYDPMDVHPVSSINDKSPIFIRIAQNAAHILACSCDSSHQQNLAASCGALSAAMRLLVDASLPPNAPRALVAKTISAAMELLGALCRDNPTIAVQVILAKKLHGTILLLILGHLEDPEIEVRLATATTMTHLYRTKKLDKKSQQVSRMVLATLSRLIQLEYSLSIQERACLCFATLVSDSEELQKLAAESEALGRVVSVVQTSLSVPPQPPVNERIPGMPLPTATYADVTGHRSERDRTAEAALLAIASACSQNENARKIVVDAAIMPLIARALAHKAHGIRAAAGQAARSISRSVMAVRTAVLDAGIAEPLVDLLDDPSMSVVLAATAALCNLVLDFAPMKDTVISKGGVGKLASLIGSRDNEIRHHATWALKNLAYKASVETKASIVQAVGWDVLRKLVETDVRATVQEQALNLVRNLACGNDDDVQVVVAGYGECALFAMLATKLACPEPDLVYQAVYTLVNIATGSEAHKAALMDHEPILEYLYSLMNHPQANIRVGCVWTLINLTWPDEVLPGQRIVRLQQRGFERQLVSMRNDSDPDVRDRVSAALQQFHHS